MQVLIIKTSHPWAQPFNHTGMFAQGHLAALLSPPAKAFKFSNNNWGIFGNSPGWGGQISPMGWGITEVTISQECLETYLQ